MEEGQLPVGWEKETLEKLVKLKTGPFGSSLHKSDYVRPGTPVLNPKHYPGGRIVPDPESHVGQAVLNRLTEFKLRAGDVILGRRGEMGRCAVVGPTEEGWLCGTGSLILRQSDVIDAYYLQRFLSSPATVAILEGESVGSTMVNLNQSILKSLEIPLAPLNEQRRIAAKLDTALVAVDSCRQRLDGVEALLKRFRQAVLAAATSGELTREWREERGIAGEWNAAQLGPLLNDMRYGTAKKCSYEAVGLPVLRIPNILESGCICQADLKYADFDAQEVAKLSLLPGDLLVIRSNGSLDLVGRVAEASEKDAGMLFAGYLIRLRPNQDKILSPYLQLALRSPSTSSTIELAARSTSGVNNINSQFLSSLAIPLPPVHEQQEIVRRTRELFSLADQLEARLTSARRIVERLTPALLAKAFRGELVPQDPSDEPASALLERLAAKKWAARQAESAAGKPSRRGRKKAAATPEASLFDAAPVPPDCLAKLLRECGSLSEKALLAASELDPARFQTQLAEERSRGSLRDTVDEDGQALLEALG